MSWFSIKFEIDNLFYNSILWTDESKFTNNGIMNKQNNRFWDDTNPHWSRVTNFQTVWGINVWCGLIDRQHLGPYFYNGTPSNKLYLDFHVNHFKLLLENVIIATPENMYILT